jgi:hypothetical protein
MVRVHDRYVGGSPYSTALARGNALTLLARSHPDVARPLLERLLAASQPDLPSSRADPASAAEEWARLQGLAYQLRVCTLNGLPLPSEVSFSKWPDPSGIPAEARNIELVHILMGEVANGGLDQYFYNSSGDEWPQTLAMLEEIQHAAAADCLRRASGLFGENGPAIDRNAREAQLEDLDDHAYASLEELSSALLETSADIERLLADYIHAHAVVFQATPVRHDVR